MPTCFRLWWICLPYTRCIGPGSCDESIYRIGRILWQGCNSSKLDFWCPFIWFYACRITRDGWNEERQLTTADSFVWYTFDDAQTSSFALLHLNTCMKDIVDVFGNVLSTHTCYRILAVPFFLHAQPTLPYNTGLFKWARKETSCRYCCYITKCQ